MPEFLFLHSLHLSHMGSTRIEMKPRQLYSRPHNANPLKFFGYFRRCPVYLSELKVASYSSSDPLLCIFFVVTFARSFFLSCLGGQQEEILTSADILLPPHLHLGQKTTAGGLLQVQRVGTPLHFYTLQRKSRKSHLCISSVLLPENLRAHLQLSV